MHTKFWRGTVIVEKLEHIDADGRVMLKCSLQQQGLKAWA
jgi:hypothetical protein